MTQPISSNSPSATPLAYERHAAEPLAGVFRDGKYLVVDRGADISACCLCCGKAASGKGIVKHLAKNPAGVSSSTFRGGRGSDPISLILTLLALILLLIYLLVLVIAWIGSRGRTVTFGLCEEHQLKRHNLKMAVWGMILGGVAMVVGGIFLTAHHATPATALVTVICVGAFVGGASLWVAAAVVGAKVPSLALVKEQNGRLWVKGACEAMVNVQPPVAASEPVKVTK